MKTRTKVINNGEFQWRIPIDIYEHFEKNGYPEGWTHGAAPTTGKKISEAFAERRRIIEEYKKESENNG